MSVVINLSRTEIMHGALTGTHRRVSSLGWASYDRYGITHDGWGRDIEAACAELAAAKAMNLYYDFSEGRFGGQGDDIPGWQVRHTTHDDGHLVLRDCDSADAFYVLVVGAVPTFTVVGWLAGRDGQAPGYLRDPGGRGHPCYWIPQERLVPIEYRPLERTA